MKLFNNNSLFRGSEAVDQGIYFSRVHKWSLLRLLLPPLILELFGHCMAHFIGRDPKQQFIVLVIVYMAKAWLLTAITLFVVKVVRGDEIGLSSILSKAAICLPKVFMSYLMLLFVVLLTVEVPPGLFMLFFLVWAPVFPALEQCLLADESLDSKSDDSIWDEEEGPEASVMGDPATIPLTWFKSKSILDLGLSRSAQLAMKHWRDAVFFMLFMWFAWIVPEAILQALGDVSENIGLILIKQTFVSVFLLFGITASIVGLLQLLPKEALEELGLVRPFDEARLFKGRGGSSRSFSKSRLGFFFALAMSLGSTVYLLEVTAAARRVPPGALANQVFSGFENEKFLLEFNLEDSKKKFRWLNPALFKLALVKSEGDLESNKEYLIAQSSKVTNESGKKLFSGTGYSSESPLNIKLYYSRPKGVEEKGFYALYYHTGPQTKQLLLSGSYPDGWR